MFWTQCKTPVDFYSHPEKGSFSGPKYEMEVTIQKKGHLCQLICSIGGTESQSVALTLEHDTHPVPPETFV